MYFKPTDRPIIFQDSPVKRVFDLVWPKAEIQHFQILKIYIFYMNRGHSRPQIGKTLHDESLNQSAWLNVLRDEFRT